jgi:hypothetical protein
VRRRDFIAVLGGAAVALPLNARPQPLDKTRRIGVLMGLADGDPEGQSDIAALREGLKELGWSEGRNLGDRPSLEWRRRQSDAGARGGACQPTAECDRGP